MRLLKVFLSQAIASNMRALLLALLESDIMLNPIASICSLLLQRSQFMFSVIPQL